MKQFMTLLLVATILAFTSCNKEANTSQEQGDISFSPTDMTEKSGEKDGEPNCELYSADYLFIVIDGVEYNLPITTIAGMMTTQTIKLDVGVHTISEFIVMNENETPSIDDDDIIIYAAVHEGAEFATLVGETIDATFTVEAFTKLERNIEVICYHEADYDAFGFEFYAVSVTNIYEYCLFGDVCVPCLEDYDGSIYPNVQPDMVAIFSVDVYRNDIFVATYSNEAWLGEGAPLCVPYADREGVLDQFKFDVSVLLPVADGFDYVYQYSYAFDDMADAGEDGIAEFVLGNCYAGDDALVLPYHTNLPSTVAFSLDGTYAPSNSMHYFDMTIDAPEGYDLTDGTYGVFCAEQTVYINLNQVYVADVYSSLDIPNAATMTSFDATKMQKLHWLVNNVDIENLGSGQWITIQNVIWSITDGLSLTVQSQIDLAADVTAGYSNYSPFAGEDTKYLVVFHHSDNVQLQVKSLPICE